MGTMLGWTSPMQPLLESDDPPVGDRPLTRQEVSWVGSINFIGAILGTFLWGRLSDRFGRKATSLIIGVPFIVGWATVLFASNTVFLYIGRVIVGLGCSGAMINTPMYVTEIAQDEIRGALGSFLMGSVNTGCLFCYIVGAFVGYQTLTSVCLAIPVIYILAFVWIPDSPVYLYTKGKTEQAEKAMQWFRGGDIVQAEKELMRLQGRARRTVGYKTLVESKGTIKAMLIGFGFIFGQQFCGILAILTYTVTIFKEAGSSLPPYVAAIIVGSLQCGASFLSSALVDKAGRKSLLGASYFFMGVCLVTLAAYFKYDLPSWIPVLSLSLHVIAYSIGAGPIPFIVMAEIFTPDVRGIAMSVIQLLGTSLSFASVKLFPTLMSFLGQDGCFLFYGVCCIVLVFFTIFGVPETKGRPLQAIIKKLNGEHDDIPEMVSKNSIMIMPAKELQPIK